MSEFNGPVESRIDPTVRKKRFKIECKRSNGAPVVGGLVVYAKNRTEAVKNFQQSYPDRTLNEVWESVVRVEEVVQRKMVFVPTRNR